MFTRYEMIAAFTRMDRGAAGLWRELDQQWMDDADEAERRFLSNLAHQLIVKLAAGETQRVAAFFEVMDDCLVRGDVLVRHLIRSILLADLQSPGLHLTTTPRQFEPWLTPAMLTSWTYAERADGVRRSLRQLAIQPEILTGPWL